MALVTADFLLLRPGFAGQTEETLDPIIDDASALVVLQCSPHLDDITPDDCPDAIKTIMVSMCRRGLRNPSGNAQETLGDYSYSAGTDGGVATIYMTRREIKIARRAVGKLGAGTLAMEGYLPTQRSEAHPISSLTDPWDAVNDE